MNYFSRSKGDQEAKAAKETVVEPRREPPPAPVRSTAATPESAKPAKPDIVSTFGPGMKITGDIACAGTLHIFGRVNGDIHAAQVMVGDSGKVEGKIIAQDVVIQGVFTGTIHGNSVKLQGKAKVEGEIFNKQLGVDHSVLFEGVSRRLEGPVAVPPADGLGDGKPVAPARPLPALLPSNEEPLTLSEIVL